MMDLNFVWSQSPGRKFRGRLLALDPGETTGISGWTATDVGITMFKAEQIKTWPLQHAVPSFTNLIRAWQPSIIVFESYRVYNWKTDQHANSNVPTLQVIGCLKTLCIQYNILYYTQSAQQAKAFVTDDKLKAWDFYDQGERHSRDSMRHGIYFLLFGPKNDS